MLKTLPQKEVFKITRFIKKTLVKAKTQKVVLGLSGGIDSAVSLFLLTQVVQPENIFIIHSYYSSDHIADAKTILKLAQIPEKNIFFINIKPIVDGIKNTLLINDQVRLGNIMARVRMILLFDRAKKENALVCGTENKSEHFLGYFTRFGDAASDFEPIQHLSKTQVYQLAKYLKIPQKIIKKPPTAGLWKNQTDEEEMGFTYQEADRVIFLYFEKKKTIAEIINLDCPNAKKILAQVAKNHFKHEVPYTL